MNNKISLNFVFFVYFYRRLADIEIFQTKALCEDQKDFYWNYERCECEGRSLVARGAGEQPGLARQENCADYLRSVVRRGAQPSILHIGGWILLGSCLALVAILAAATWHYRYTLHLHTPQSFLPPHL